MTEIINLEEMPTKVVYEIVENEKWKEMSQDEIQEIINIFVPKENDIKIDMNKFNYGEVYDRDYYVNKFPHFPANIHDILAESSKKKIGIIKDQPDASNNTFSKKVGEFEISFE